ncbi:MAG TPA: hypothetical protein VFB29_01455 [Pseudolabrys sp.]|nr:hypothetical protein [Pseudolabrys sp.]
MAFEFETGTRLMKKAIFTLTFVASLVAGIMVLATAGDALANANENLFDRQPGTLRHVPSDRAWVREVHNDRGRVSGEKNKDNDRDRHKSKKSKKKRDKHKGRDTYKDSACGGKKKCPPQTGVIKKPVQGTPPISSGGGDKNGGSTGGTPTMTDPGYGQLPKGGSPGAGSPGGPSRDPVDRGSGATIKQK